MFTIALVYGSIAGAISIGVIIAAMASGPDGDFFSSSLFGYLVMLVALSLVFLGIKRHRDLHRGGIIGFGPAFLTGLAISAAAGAVYVAIWEVYLAATDYQFMSAYTAHLIEDMRASGASSAEIADFEASMKQMAENYANPFFRIPISFLEIFPVGVLVSLVSALLLRNPRFLPMTAR